MTTLAWMGRIVYWMNVSLDLRIEHHDGEQGGGEWMTITEELHREFNRRARELVLGIEGRTIYETMESFWPAARHDESLPEVLREYAEIWTSAPKVLVSHTRTHADHNTMVIGGDGDAVERIGELREHTDGSIGVGGATLATQLLHAGLLDELLLFVHPVVLGSGRPLFDQLHAPLACQLIEQRAFDGGVTMLHYAIERR